MGPVRLPGWCGVPMATSMARLNTAAPTAPDVFKIMTNGTLSALYSFTGGSDGANPAAGLVLGTDGNFYGTAEFGGATGSGTYSRSLPAVC